VPFASDSELWPYTRGPVQENSHSDLDDDDDDGDIVELSFEETSVLSDPEAFKKALQRKKSGLKEVETSVNGHRYVNGTSSPFSEKEKGKENKKSRKERDAIARREIEESWDIPPPKVVDSVVNSSSRSFNTFTAGSSCITVSSCLTETQQYIVGNDINFGSRDDEDSNNSKSYAW